MSWSVTATTPSTRPPPWRRNSSAAVPAEVGKSGHPLALETSRGRGAGGTAGGGVDGGEVVAVDAGHTGGGEGIGGVGQDPAGRDRLRSRPGGGGHGPDGAADQGDGAKQGQRQAAGLPARPGQR